MSDIRRIDSPRTLPITSPVRVPTPQIEPVERLTGAGVVDRMNTLAMASMIAKVRRPPLLKLRQAGTTSSSAYEDMLHEWSEPLSRMSTGQLSYLVSRTLQRQMVSDPADHDPELIAGLQTLDRIARMYEHLAMLQSGPTDVA